MKYLACIFLLSCTVTIACRNSNNKEILGIDSMKVVMWDIMKSDELYLRILAKDSSARRRKENIRLYEQVFYIHHLHKGLFDSSYRFYEAHPVQFKLLIDSLEAYSKREKEKFTSKHGQAD